MHSTPGLFLRCVNYNYDQPGQPDKIVRFCLYFY